MGTLKKSEPLQNFALLCERVARQSEISPRAGNALKVAAAGCMQTQALSDMFPVGLIFGLIRSHSARGRG